MRLARVTNRDDGPIYALFNFSVFHAILLHVTLCWYVKMEINISYLNKHLKKELHA